METNKQNTSKRNDTYKRQHEENLDTLFRESGAIANQKDGVSITVRALSTILQHWILTKYKGYVREECDEDLEYFDDVVKGTFDALEFIAIISDCHESAYHSFRRLGESEKEVGNGK